VCVFLSILSASELGIMAASGGPTKAQPTLALVLYFISCALLNGMSEKLPFFPPSLSQSPWMISSSSKTNLTGFSKFYGPAGPFCIGQKMVGGVVEELLVTALLLACALPRSEAQVLSCGLYDANYTVSFHQIHPGFAVPSAAVFFISSRLLIVPSASPSQTAASRAP
jgi:hypothetical protein